MSDPAATEPKLVVVTGRPGTGKSTLARAVARDLRAAHLRLDAIQAAVIRSGHGAGTFGLVGYLVAQEISAGCLAVGTAVVVDSVSPVANARRLWRTVAAQTGAVLRVIEVSVSDPEEHRRRVEARVGDLEGVTPPSWARVQASTYEPWDVERDGPRLAVDNLAAPEVALQTIRPYLGIAPP